ncbi:MAG: trypsin-like peptidase domain-containing protein [Elusimicrobia bacterium]|nr:trypsin-like peptidase domain-containing protein [Elusimicrobiota bacterium]
MTRTRSILATLALCASPFLAAAETPSLEALRADGSSSFTFEQAQALPSPGGLIGPRSHDMAASVLVRHTTISDLDAGVALFGYKDYQLGDEWGKKPVTAASMAGESLVFQRAAKATARYGSATAFYIGFFNGHHMMATNRHVMSSMGCGAAVEFVLLGKRFACEMVYGEWREIDLALFSIRVPPGDQAALSGIGRNFAFEAAIYPGQELLTIGFGVANNLRGRMMANQDSDCKVFSGSNEFRKMADPDEFSPGPDKVWSFANACDISHGDSGSAYVDRRTGDVVGIVWTGRIPKSPQVASSLHLDEMLRAQSPEIWTELSYTVPAASIRDGLKAALSGPLSADAATTISAILGPSADAVAAR